MSNYFEVKYYVRRTDFGAARALMNYKDILASASFALGNNKFLVPSQMVNTLARLWTLENKNFDTLNGTDTGQGVPPV